MTPAATLLHKLLGYIHEQAKDIDPRGFRLSDTKKFLLRQESAAGLPGLEFDKQVEGDHIWLRIARLKAESPPPLPDRHKDEIRTSSDPNGSKPFLDEAAFLQRLGKLTECATTEDKSQIEAAERSIVGRAIETYQALWESWAEGERPRRKSIALYGDLFALKHNIESEETAKPQEVVWGIGLALWRIPFEDNHVFFEYPLLTQSVEISIDESLALEIRPRDTRPQIELDALIALQVPGAADVDLAMKTQLDSSKDRSLSPFDAGSYGDVLRLAAGNLDSKGTYQETFENSSGSTPGEHLLVTDRWAIFSRSRSNNYLFEDLKRLQERLKDCALPPGPLALVTPPSDTPIEYEAVHFRGLSSRGNTGSAEVEELFFPLPYNDEQVTIVQRLERAPGVTVQGPPGTGKTHTIANIICHYLATGRRVLVTSRGEPALEVLQTKIPEEVRPLTVALLASDREGVRQFQGSIEAIQHRVSQLNPEQIRRDIDNLQSSISRTHRELTLIDRRIDEIASVQLSEVVVDGNEMRPQKLAECVVSGQQLYGWFDDIMSLEPRHTPPLSEAEATALRSARRLLGKDLVYVESSIPAADDLPQTSTIVTLHQVLSRIRTIDGEIANGNLLSLKQITPDLLQAARALVAEIDQAIELVEAIGMGQNYWPFEVRAKCRSSSYIPEREALESLFKDLETLMEARSHFLQRPVEFPDDALASAKTREAVERAALNGKPFGVISFGNSSAKEHLAKVRVDGLPPDNRKDWGHVAGYIRLHDQVISFGARWNHFAADLSLPHLNGHVRHIREIEAIAVMARKAHRLATHYDVILPRMAETVFEKPPSSRLAGTVADLKEIREQLLRHLTKVELSLAATELSSLHEKLAGKTGPISDRVRAFVDHAVGNPSLAQEHIAAEYAEIVAELRRIASFSFEIATVRDLSKRIEEAGAVKLASRTRLQPNLDGGDDHIFPSNWREAWTWARMRDYLNRIESRQELVAASIRRGELEGVLARLYRQVVENSAWLAAKRNASPRVLQALAGYATAIRRIGQGTGPNAMRYRRDAREAMSDAAGAVPCWIMSHARISESMPADIGMFDLVIVDEASQSDLWALPAILRGKKILIVGDDKQVSPDAGFIAAQRIQELRDRFLWDQPYGTEMTPEKSLYDLAARVFAAEQVMLREHFRCVPAIIAYSNRHFYKNAIRPLRIPTACERIEPPLVDIYIPGGMRNKRDCNEYEAMAIAEEIETILKDSRLSKRTIGVVSLLGLEQAKHTDELVRQRCDQAELIRRRFECGDARTFQGSERDIMFLSMVVDPENSKAVSGNLFDQRFNVAASRSRDRMYLVRSVKPSELSERDLRMTLLSHFDKPLVTEDEESDRLIDRCESGFEKQVFIALTSKGYRVLPQVKTGAYRIDLVVEGLGDSRLAIECDGDDFHGPDRWPRDMTRQRVLERAGWRFWRCFASTWIMRREEVFAELLERLSMVGVEPVGALHSAPRIVEKRVWTPKNTDFDTATDASQANS